MHRSLPESLFLRTDLQTQVIDKWREPTNLGHKVMLNIQGRGKGCLTAGDKIKAEKKLDKNKQMPAPTTAEDYVF